MFNRQTERVAACIALNGSNGVATQIASEPAWETQSRIGAGLRLAAGHAKPRGSARRKTWKAPSSHRHGAATPSTRKSSVLGVPVTVGIVTDEAAVRKMPGSARWGRTGPIHRQSIFEAFPGRQ